MSLWSFQGARGLLRTTRGCRHPSCNSRTDPVSQNSTAYVKDHRGQRYFQASPLDTTFTLEGGTEPDGNVRCASRDGLRRIEIHRIPRKEVIQPQLPLRLPCYDFTPIIDPTFDGSLPCGLGHRLRVLPTFVV